MTRLVKLPGSTFELGGIIQLGGRSVLYHSTVWSGRLMYVREYYDEAKGQGERRETGALDD